MNRFDDDVNELSEELSYILPQRLAVFFALVALRLLPLHNNHEAIVRLWDEVWSVVTGSVQPGMVPGLISRIEEQTPHGDEDDNLQATFGQDVAIMLDSAIKWLVTPKDASTEWVQYGLEPFKMAVCFERYGVIDPGDLFSEAFDSICSDERYNREVGHMRNDIKVLSAPGSIHNWGTLRDRALKEQWKAHDFGI